MSKDGTRVTLSSVRLTGDQSGRIMQIARERTCELYEYHDHRLSELGLVVVGPVGLFRRSIRKRIEHRIDAAWGKIKSLVKEPKISADSIKIIVHAASEMHNAAYHLEKRHVALTKAGRELAAKGRTVVIPGRAREEKNAETS